MPRIDIFKLANAGLALAVGWHFGTEVFFEAEKMLAVSKPKAVLTFVLYTLLFTSLNGSISAIIGWGSKLGDKE